MDKTILGIDFGERKIGLAISTYKIADPLVVLKYNDLDKVILQINKIVEENKVEKILVGISEGEMAKKTTDFANKLKEVSKKEVIFEDETLTSQDAIRLSIDAGNSRKKRKEMEDAFAAAVVLQSYLDKNV